MSSSWNNVVVVIIIIIITQIYDSLLLEGLTRAFWTNVRDIQKLIHVYQLGYCEFAAEFIPVNLRLHSTVDQDNKKLTNRIRDISFMSMFGRG